MLRDEYARRHGCAMSRAAGRAHGFTLVELLVVVSIIALLISILLPSLKNARDQAKRLKCQANVAQIAKAGWSYITEERDWIPGAAGTTGGVLLGRYASRAIDDTYVPEPPVQIWDYAGPLAAIHMGMSSLPPNRGERWKLLVEDTIFVCPSNQLISVPFPAPTDFFKAQKMVSYNTVRNFMMWAKTADGGDAPFDPAITSRDGISDTVKVPGRYKPRIERVGQPSEKIFLADGSRFTTDEGEIDHDIAWDARFGGGFSDGGPTLPKEYLRSYMLDDPERLYAYRHGQSKRPGLVAAYFDGHADWWSEEQSRFPDPWWPKGTVIPRREMNQRTVNLVRDYFVGSDYRVQR